MVFIFAHGALTCHSERNYGIVVFGMEFVLALVLFTEFNMSMAVEAVVVLFKPGSKVGIGS